MAFCELVNPSSTEKDVEIWGFGATQLQVIRGCVGASLNVEHAVVASTHWRYPESGEPRERVCWCLLVCVLVRYGWGLVTQQ